MNIKQTILISKIFVTMLLVWMAVIWWQKEEITLKEMQIMSIAETHSEKGLSFTHGYNFYPDYGGNYSHEAGSKTGGVKSVVDTNYTAYVSAPVLVPIATWSVMEIFGIGAHASKFLFLIFSFLLLWVFFKFASLYVPELTRYLFILFIVTPFFLFNFYYNDLNLNSMVLSFVLISYLFFLKYLKERKERDLILFALFVGLSFWSSFFILSIFPVFFLHLILEESIERKSKFNIGFKISIILLLIIASILVYYAMLPGAIDKAISRVGERMTGVQDIENYEEKGSIPLMDFASKLVIRIVSHFSPVALILSIIGLIISIRKLIIDSLKNKFQINSMSLEFILLMLFAFGAPSALLLYTGSFIHPYFIYQWIPFFTLGSYMGLIWLTEVFPKWRRVLIFLVVSLFLVFSLPRTIAKVSGKSLIDLLFNGKMPNWYKQTSWMNLNNPELKLNKVHFKPIDENEIEI